MQQESNKGFEKDSGLGDVHCLEILLAAEEGRGWRCTSRKPGKTVRRWCRHRGKEVVADQSSCSGWRLGDGLGYTSEVAS